MPSAFIPTLISLFILLILPFLEVSGFEKVIIWGHKLNSHTHSYISEFMLDFFKLVREKSHD
jgi:hypothetical protein